MEAPQSSKQIESNEGEQGTRFHGSNNKQSTDGDRQGVSPSPATVAVFTILKVAIATGATPISVYAQYLNPKPLSFWI